MHHNNNGNNSNTSSSRSTRHNASQVLVGDQENEEEEEVRRKGGSLASQRNSKDVVTVRKTTTGSSSTPSSLLVKRDLRHKQDNKEGSSDHEVEQKEEDEDEEKEGLDKRLSSRKRVAKDEDLMRKATSSPIISCISSSSRRHQGLKDPPTPNPTTTTVSTSGEASNGPATVTRSATTSTLTHHDSSPSREAQPGLDSDHLSTLCRSLDVIADRIEQLVQRMDRMECSQNRLMDLLLLVTPLSPGTSSARGTESQAFVCQQQQQNHHNSSPLLPVLVNGSGNSQSVPTNSSNPGNPAQNHPSVLPSSASLPLDCLSFNSIHLSFPHHPSSTQPVVREAVHPLFQSILTGYHMHPPTLCPASTTAANTTMRMSSSSSSPDPESKAGPPDSLPLLQSPGHDSLLSSGESTSRPTTAASTLISPDSHVRL